MELAVYTTQNIGPYSDIFFDGTTLHNDLMLIVEGPKDTNIIYVKSDQPNFEAVTEGWVTIDFKGTVFIHFFKMLEKV